MEILRGVVELAADGISLGMAEFEFGFMEGGEHQFLGGHILAETAALETARTAEIATIAIPGRDAVTGIRILEIEADRATVALLGHLGWSKADLEAERSEAGSPDEEAAPEEAPPMEKPVD